jgi:peptidoglycan/xylan/chitin deacetylase (PgdA/CDA1 family)
VRASPFWWVAVLALLLVAPLARADSDPDHDPDLNHDHDPDHAVILVYHHVSEDTPASTSVTPAQFEQHLEYLASGGYRVWSLPRVLAAVFERAEPLPPDVVAITFDDAYESVFSEARPRLAARGWPYSVFVNTDAIDAGHSPYMDWEALQVIAEEGVTIGSHSAAHGHMAAPASGESDSDWRRRVAADIAKAHERLSEEVGREPEVFAYPYGEDSAALAELVASRYRWALAQRSGPVGALTDPLSIPRFPMATGFASEERLALAIRSRPLPVRQLQTSAADRRGEVDWIDLSLDPGDYRSAEIACFSGSGDRLSLDPVSADPRRVRIDVEDVGRVGRNKVNCTAPASDGSGDFYWYSYQWLIEP